MLNWFKCLFKPHDWSELDYKPAPARWCRRCHRCETYQRVISKWTVHRMPLDDFILALGRRECRYSAQHPRDPRYRPE